MTGIKRTQPPGTIQLTSTEVRFTELCKILYHVNQLTAFPMVVEQIQDWAKSLLLLIPDLEFNALEFLINEMKLSRYEFDKNLGIQNLTRGLALIKKNKSGYYISQTSISW